MDLPQLPGSGSDAGASNFKLGPFPEAVKSTNTIGRQLVNFDIDAGIKGDVFKHVEIFAATAWCTTLYLYAGDETVKFSFSLEGQPTTMVEMRVKVQDQFQDLYRRLRAVGHLEGSIPESGSSDSVSNAAILFRKGTDDGSNKSKLCRSKLLPEGVDICLSLDIDPELAVQTYCLGSTRNWALSYRHAIMSDLEAERFALTLRHIISSMITNPSATLRTASLSPSEFSTIVDWNAQTPLIRRASLLHEELAKICQAQPAALALLAWDGRMTYKELDRASSQLSRHLSSMHPDSVGAGKWVALCFDKSIWAVVALISVLRTGSAFVFIDPSYPESRMKHIMETTEARIVITTGRRPEYSKKLAALMHKGEKGVVKVPLDGLAGKRPKTAGTGVLEERAVQPDDPAAAIFTSGSTGLPKGITLSHANICTSIFNNFTRSLAISPETRILQFASYTFDASISDVFAGLLGGGTVCIPSEAQRKNNLEAYMRTQQVNLAFLTPTVARLVNAEAVRLTMRKLCLIGEAVKETDVRSWLNVGVEVYNGYGPAEGSFMATLRRFEDDTTQEYGTQQRKASNIGLGLNNRTWIVENAGSENDEGRLVPMGVNGELCIEGPGLALGYIKDDAKTRASFLVDPFWLPSMGEERTRRVYRTGDMVRYCLDGSLEYMGRIGGDAQVKLGGQRVELAEIEHYLRQVDATMVSDSAVLFPKLGPLKERLTGILALATDESTPSAAGEMRFSKCEQDLASQCSALLSQSLPSHMVPASWIVLDRFPVNASGKRNSKKVLEKLEGLSEDDYATILGRAKTNQQDMSPTATTSEQSGQEQHPADERTQSPAAILQQVCSEVLHRPLKSVVMDYSFVELGGDSIAAMSVASLVRRLGGLDVDVADILACPSLGDAAERMRSTSVSDIKEKHDDKAAGPLRGNATVYLGEIDKYARAIPQINGVVDEIEDIYPCSPAQEWITTCSVKSTLRERPQMRAGAYGMSFLWRIYGNRNTDSLITHSVDADRLQAAWQKVVQRHSALRTVLLVTRAGPGIFDQVVLRRHSPTCEIIQAKNSGEALRLLSSRSHEEFTRIANSPRPPHRVTIVETEEESDVLFKLDINHVLMDGLSAKYLLRDLLTTYRGGELKAIESGALADFVRYARDPGRRGASVTRLNQLVKDVKPRILFDGHENVAVKGRPGCDNDIDSVPVQIDSKTYSEINSTLTKQQVSLSDLFKLVWAFVLHKHLAQDTETEDENDNIVFSYRSSARHVPVMGIEEAVGCFISTLTCSVNISPRSHIIADGHDNHAAKPVLIKDVLKKIAKEAADMERHHQFASPNDFTSGNDESNKKDQLLNTSISVLPCLDVPAEKGALVGIAEVNLEDPTEADMSLVVQTSPEVLRVRITYQRGAINRKAVEEIVGTLHMVLKKVLEDPSREVNTVRNTLGLQDIK